MKVERFNENISNTKFYVYSVHPNDRTYSGSVWDTDNKKWIPDNAILIGEFELNTYRNYMIVSQSELDEITEIKKNKLK